MRRLLMIVIIATGAVGAVVLPEPAEPPSPIAPPQLAAATPVAGVWYCPWLESSFEKDGSLALVALVDTAAALTFPQPRTWRTSRQHQPRLGRPRRLARFRRRHSSSG